MNKTAFVTGASRGIGRQVALELARKNYFVFLAARDKAALQHTKSEIEHSGGQAEVIILDLLTLDSIKDAAKFVKQSGHQLTILANIAGMYHDDEKHFFDIPFEDYPDDAIIKNINASLVGHVLLTKYLVPYLAAGACVINTSGTFGKGETGVISDFLAKKGIELFSQQLALELKDHGIRSNCVRLGFVLTENVHKFFPEVKPEDALDPQEVAQQIVRLAENPRMNGQIKEIIA